MAIFTSCEVAAGPHGQQVVATAPVDPGTALVVDEEVIFAVECQHMQARCALCCCTCAEEVTGVACKVCDARCARDPALQRWADAAQLLGPAQGSVALCAAALAAGTIDFGKLVHDSRELDSRTLQIFQLVAGNLARITKRTEEDCFARRCVVPLKIISPAEIEKELWKNTARLALGTLQKLRICMVCFAAQLLSTSRSTIGMCPM